MKRTRDRFEAGLVVGFGLTVGACAGELSRPHQAVEVVPPATVDARADALEPGDAFVPVDARPPRPDAALPAPSDLRVFLRVRADDRDRGLRAALTPPQAADGSADAVLDALGDAIVPVFDWGRPGDPHEARLLARLGAGAVATVVYAPGQFPDRVPTDVRHLGAFVLDDARCAAWDGRPVLFIEPPAVGAVLADALERLAALPHPPAVLLGFDALDPAPLPAGLSVAAAATVVGRWPVQATGWATDGRGDLPDAAETRALAAGWRLAAATGPVLPRVRTARNPRLDRPDAPLEPPGAEQGFLRSLVLARRLAPRGETGGVFVEGLGGWRDDGQLDPLAADAETSRAPAALTDGHPYPAYGGARLAVFREVLLDATDVAEPSTDPGTGTADLAELHRSDSIAVTRLESVGGRVEVAFRDRTAGGRWEVLLAHRRFRIPEGARVRYGRTEPTLRVEWVLAPVAGADGPPEDRASTTLDALAPDAPPTGVIEVDVSSLAGRVVDSVVLLYEGGAGEVQGSVTLPVVVPGP